jgi:hypothetical protein
LIVRIVQTRSEEGEIEFVVHHIFGRKKVIKARTKRRRRGWRIRELKELKE